MQDRANPFVLGFFVGLFGCCPLALSGIRDTAETIGAIDEIFPKGR